MAIAPHHSESLHRQILWFEHLFLQQIFGENPQRKTANSHKNTTVSSIHAGAAHFISCCVNIFPATQDKPSPCPLLPLYGGGWALIRTRPHPFNPSVSVLASLVAGLFRYL